MWVRILEFLYPCEQGLFAAASLLDLDKSYSQCSHPLIDHKNIQIGISPSQELASATSREQMQPLAQQSKGPLLSQYLCRR